MPPQLTIRKETASDIAEVYDVNRTAFDREDEANLVDALRTNSSAFIPELSIVAASENGIAGHILFTKISIHDGDGIKHDSLALAPMAVRPDLQNQGIGGRLIRHGFDVAKHLGFKSVIVLGHPDYYPRFGFEPAGQWGIKAPFDVSSEAFMAIELGPGGLQHVSGTVNYPKEFSSP
ncbi:GNAT family N-acetyltransferase [Rhodohalobacter sp. 8-1]|uniref:GNAT family N-acetyltransferase n=1 Tax=Rhodohalobacter sp. 8-1 TaxID=3131972 RepID=UPI0030ECD47C